MSETNKLRISVWAAHDHDAPLMIEGPCGENGKPMMKELPRVASGLHCEVYSWQTDEDVFGGVVDLTRRAALREALFDTLRPEKAPNERGVDALKRFIELARQTLAEGGVEWNVSVNSSDDDGERRLNSLLALTVHLEWLAAVHDGQPGISVTAR